MANYTQFAVPGLMTPHAPNFKSNIIANEAGNIIMLLHSGVATDCVHYCLVIGGRRFEGVVKDPSYHFVNGMDGREMDANKHNKAPDFLYKTTDLPDEVYIPKVNIKGCPTPITELNKAQDKVYFILKLPRTTLPQGDTVVQVTINGRMRQYIVQRPTFFIHVPRYKTISNRYLKLANTPEARFNVEIDQNQDSKISIDITRNNLSEDCLFGAELINKEFGKVTIYVDRTIDGSELILTVPAALPAGHYKLIVSYKETVDQEKPFRLIYGYIEVKESEVVQLKAQAKARSIVELTYDIPESIKNYSTVKGTIQLKDAEEYEDIELAVTQEGIAFNVPETKGEYTVKMFMYSIEGCNIEFINLTLTVI